MEEIRNEEAFEMETIIPEEELGYTEEPAGLPDVPEENSGISQALWVAAGVGVGVGVTFVAHKGKELVQKVINTEARAARKQDRKAVKEFKKALKEAHKAPVEEEPAGEDAVPEEAAQE